MTKGGHYKWFQKAANQGYARGQCNLGLMYAQGRGVGQDYAAVVMWFQKAANQRLAEAQFNLGQMYKNGNGCGQSDAKAAEWYRKAAAQGYVLAMYLLGFMYEKGRGVTRDYTEAVKWYRKAADQRHPPAFKKLQALADNEDNADAQYNLGVMYAKGRGVTRDDTEAVKWYIKAVEKGDARALCQLADSHERRGIPKDYKERSPQWSKNITTGGDKCLTFLMLQHYPAVLYDHSEHFNGLNKDRVQQVMDDPSLYYLIRFMTQEDYVNFFIASWKRATLSDSCDAARCNKKAKSSPSHDHAICASFMGLFAQEVEIKRPNEAGLNEAGLKCKEGKVQRKTA